MSARRAAKAVLVLAGCVLTAALGVGCDGAGAPASGATATPGGPRVASSGSPSAAGSGSVAGAASASASGSSSAAGSSAPASSAAATAAGSGKCGPGMVEVAHPTAPFCMSKTEVTVAQFRACVDAGKCNYKKPVNPGCNWLDDTKGNHPMNCVGRTNAAEYCLFQNARLPSVEEWEHASRDGEASRPYVWGTADPQKELVDNLWCWSGKQKRNGTCEVGSFPAGATKAGLLDMAGNLAEWATGGDVDEKSKTCGRAWDASEGWKAMEKCPGGYFAEAQVPVIGFRCLAPAK